MSMFLKQKNRVRKKIYQKLNEPDHYQHAPSKHNKLV